ncbi:M13 family metallopeptidase [Candidatus Marsarchaeota archaeon]|nr:M13 family metallopeptidase [Candidatus Marsarchaeota archaeon]MCL5404705.1 M13 family metallopeptidase [Candidatus Marsarchaeota archaeon]
MINSMRKRSISFSTSNMNESADPFDDFYMYACGNWIKSHRLPKDKTSVNSFSLLWDINMLKLRHIAEYCAAKSVRSSAERVVGDFYASYMNVDELEKRKFTPIKPIMEKIDALQSKNELPATLAKLYTLGIPVFLNVFSDCDKKKSDVYALYIQEAGINLPERSYYLEKRFAKARFEYRKHIAAMLRLYGTEERGAEGTAGVVMDIETRLARASKSSAEERDEAKSYNKESAAEMAKKYPRMNFMGFLDNLGVKGIGYAIVDNPDYLIALDALIYNTSMEKLKAYLRWSVINAYAPLLHKAAQAEHFRFYGTVLAGQKKNEPRWKRGIYRTSEMLNEVIGSIYVKKNFSEGAKKRAEELVDSIKKAFRARLANNAWMSSRTKKAAIEKLDAMKAKVGYPKRFRDYSSLHFDRRDLVGNAMKAYAFELERQLKRIGKKVDSEEWLMSVTEPDAYNDFSRNEIVVTAGILQQPFFDAKADAAINFGGIGAILGHEMTHGFDDQGRLFDKRGNMGNQWSAEDMRRFAAKASKIAKLYGSISILPGIKVNGELTMGENIADLGGISIAYDALKANCDLNEKVDGFTEEQRFFIAYAQIWKDISTKESLEMRAYTDPHSPARVRGIVPVVSHPRFAKAFKPLSKLERPKQQYENANLW